MSDSRQPTARPSAPAVLRRLARLHPTVVFLGTFALLIAAMLLPGPVGGVLLLLMAAGLAVLLVTTWPVQPVRTRVLRLTVLLLLIAVALVRTF